MSGGVPAQSALTASRGPVPRPAESWFSGSLPAAKRDPIALFQDAFNEFGDVVAMSFGPPLMRVEIVFFAHPDHIRQVLQEHHKSFTKSRQYLKLKPFLGEGLLTSEGSFWLRQRRIAQPSFHNKVVAGFAGVMADSTEALLRDWEARQRDGAPVDVAREMMRLTLRIVGLTLLRTDLAAHAESLGNAVTEALRWTDERMNTVLPIPLNVPTPANRRFVRAVAQLDALVFGVIEARRRSGGAEADDLVGMLMAARDEETGEGMSDVQLRDELITFLFAGHETTANALAWSFYLLSRHPEAARRLHEEATGVLGGRMPTVDDLPRLPWARQVLDEAMRLFPPAWLFERAAIEPVEIGDVRLEPGVQAIVSPWVTHRHPDFWDNPEGFDPERFSETNQKNRHKFAYFPFGGGPRICIGRSFALLEAHLVLAAIAQRFRLDLVPGRRVEPEPVITLRPRGGLPMHIRNWS